MKIIDKYILRELAGPFLFGVAVFTVLLVAGFILPKLTDLFADARLGPQDALLLFIYLLPRNLVLTFAMAALLAVLLGFGRLSAESEVVAMHAAGLSLPRLAIPGIIFGLAVSFLTLAVTEKIVPFAGHQSEIIINHAKGKTTKIVNNVIYYERGEGNTQRSIYAGLFDTQALTMQDVTITEFEDSKPVGVIHAQSASRNPAGTAWQLSSGASYLLKEGLPALSDRFQQKTITYFASPEKIVARGKKKPLEMSRAELQAHIASLRSSGEDTIKYEIELPRRLALPLAALVFTLIGTPLGMRSHRRSSSLGVGLTVLIVFFYYIVWNWLAVAAEHRTVSPNLAAWLPNIAFGLTGLTLILRSKK